MTLVTPVILPPRDYDAADPNRNTVTYLRAAANVSVVNWAIWQYDWIVDKEPIYRVTGKDISNNHINGFPLDADTLNANFFGHPYSGAMFFGAARSTGLTLWESTPYVVGGSLMWEMLSESQKPSSNDIVATSLGGIAIGEMLHRLSSLALDDAKSGFARFTRELSALAISPTRGGNRIVTGEAWASGASPISKPARLSVHGGIDQVSAGTVTDAAKFSPSALIAIDAEYGDLLPAPAKVTIPAYDFFDLYAAAVFSSQPTSGFDVASLGLLHGWSTDVSNEGGPYRSNNVLGLVQSVDYHGIDAIDFAAFGLGLGDFLVLRGGPRTRLRLSLDADWAPLAAVSSPVNPYAGTADIRRNYNYSMGVALGLGVRWDMGRLGQLGLRAREYGTNVIDGIRGQEAVGYAHLWYEVEAIPDCLGVGIAPKFMHRMGSYTRARTDEATQLSIQLYATLRL